MPSRLAHNWSLKLLALVVAVVMWAFVVGQEKAETIVKVPVEFVAVPQGLAVTGDVVDEVDVRLQGPRSLVRRAADEGMVKQVSLAGMKAGEHTFHVTADDFALPPWVEVARISPASITVKLGNLDSRQVRVVPRFSGRPAPGYEVDATFEPETVAVSGVEDDLAYVDWIWTVPLDVEGKKTSLIKAKVALRKERGLDIKIEPPVVQATIRIRPKGGESKAKQ